MNYRILPLILILQSAGAQNADRPVTRADILKGEYGRYRSNNDLLHYDLHVRVDPDKKSLSGSTTVRFKMLKDDSRIQLDLYPHLAIDQVTFKGSPIKFERELTAVFIDFQKPLKAGKTYAVEIKYSGSPPNDQRGFGGIGFRKDPQGRPWVTTSCEGPGSSIWWPSKDQWHDEPDQGINISVEVPNGLMDVSNGRFVGSKDLGDGYTRWDWEVHYPINHYDVSLNIANYTHFGDQLGDLTLDFYCLPENLEKAKKQFAQAKPMIQIYEKFIGPYAFRKDGYKLVEVPYAGMEHQSAVTYGNHFANGYLERDWTGVGISPKFDFIIIHESGHEWFGNAVSAADVSDMWIHEGWTTYMECIYVEGMFGKADAMKYVNSYKSKVMNRTPIITQRGVHATPPQDMYFKGALFLNTLRSTVDDDKRWWKLLQGYYRKFRYKNIMTEDMIAYFNAQLGMELTPIFRQYLWHTQIPTLHLKPDNGLLAYRWETDEPGFNLPAKISKSGSWQLIHPTTEWQRMPKPADTAVATDLYYIKVVTDDN